MEEKLKELSSLRLLVTGTFCLFYCLIVFGAEDPAKNILDEKTVRAWLAAQAARDPGKAWTWEVFAYKHAHRHPGKPITGAELNEFDPPTIGGNASGSATTQAKPPVGTIATIASHLKIRSNFDDTLASEDPSLAASDTASKGSISDLTGAIFSYTRDFKANSDLWVAKGALIYLFNQTV